MCGSEEELGIIIGGCLETTMPVLGGPSDDHRRIPGGSSHATMRILEEYSGAPTRIQRGSAETSRSIIG